MCQPQIFWVSGLDVIEAVIDAQDDDSCSHQASQSEIQCLKRNRYPTTKEVRRKFVFFAINSICDASNEEPSHSSNIPPPAKVYALHLCNCAMRSRKAYGLNDILI